MQDTNDIKSDWLHNNGFDLVATLQTHPREIFEFDYEPSVRNALDIVYIAEREGEILYVGKAKNFRGRYGYGHIRWLRGEKTNSEGQRLRWVAEVEKGPIRFFARRASQPLLVEERALINQLNPRLNAA